MTIEKMKEMMDACYFAKRIGDMLPELPDGVAPSYIRFMDIITQLREKNGKVRVSDISHAINIPKPGVTRTIKEMEVKGYVRKILSNEDARITYIELTGEGEKVSEKYNKTFFYELAGDLEDVSTEDADCTISTIRKMYKVMCERRLRDEKRSRF